MTNQNVDLKRAGLKVTLPRLNILSILSESADEGAHLSAEDVYQRLRDAGDDVGLATVYRVLTQFETAGLVERHNFESGHSVFELATDDHHDHGCYLTCPHQLLFRCVGSQFFIDIHRK